METKKYTIMKYLSQVEVEEIAKNFSLFQKWDKANTFGFKYYYTKLIRFDADRKENKIFLIPQKQKPKEKVFLCKSKDKYWISLVYGHKEYLDSPLVIKNFSLLNENPEKWEKICKDEGE